MEFSRQEYWSGFPFPSPGDLPNPGTEPDLLYCILSFHELSHHGSPLGYMLGLKAMGSERPAPSPVMLRIFQSSEVQGNVQFPCNSEGKWLWLTGTDTSERVNCLCFSTFSQGRKKLTLKERNKNSAHCFWWGMVRNWVRENGNRILVTCQETRALRERPLKDLLEWECSVCFTLLPLFQCNPFHILEW